jgi:MYXO-CTERM domain-containing protein
MRGAVACVLAALALPAAAEAQARVILEVCGAEECRRFSSETHQALVEGVAVPKDYELSPPSPLLAYYRLQLHETGSIIWVPQGGRLRTSFWITPSVDLIPLLDEATAGLEPFPPPKLERVTIAGRPVADPEAFQDLFAVFETAPPAPSDARHVDIVVRSDWVTTVRPLEYFPLEDVLQRYGEWVRPSAELSDRIEEELQARAAEEQSDWPAYASLAALVAAGVGLLWLRTRRRRSPAPEP